MTLTGGHGLKVVLFRTLFRFRFFFLRFRSNNGLGAGDDDLLFADGESRVWPGGGWGGGGTQVVHGRSRMTIDPRIPTMAGWSTPGFTN